MVLIGGAYRCSRIIISPDIYTGFGTYLSEQNRESITRISSLLPDYPSGGFELNLTNPGPIDFHQGFFSLDEWATKLTTHINNNPLIAAEPNWQRILNFCTLWSSGDTEISRVFLNLWFEFDTARAGQGVPTPSIFLALSSRSKDGQIKPNLLPAIEDALSICGLQRLFPSRLNSIERIISELPSRAVIPYLGLMLSRPDAPIRVIVDGIGQAQFPEFLEKIGWPSDKRYVTELHKIFSKRADRILLHLDILDIVQPRLGFECYVPKQDAKKHWTVFLDHLIIDGLCTEKEKTLLLEWPGLSPLSDFPGNREKPEHVDLLKKWISLIKVDYRPSKPLVAKGYLEMGKVTLDLNKRYHARKDLPPGHETTVEDQIKLESTNLQTVRNYYDSINTIIVRDVGNTYQAGTLISNGRDDTPYRTTNLYLASRAGIQAGQHLLDAGCGVCGPSIDIIQKIGNLKIDAITLSTAQAQTARKLIQKAGLTKEIRVHIGDFHCVPFANETFDMVFFFESSGYSYDQNKLFAEAYRVLKVGGTIYIKDVFRNETLLSAEEVRELTDFNKIYGQFQTPCLAETKASIINAGFSDISLTNLNQVLTTEEFGKAMIKDDKGHQLLTDFGEIHYRNFKNLPVFFAEIKAKKT